MNLSKYKKAWCLWPTDTKRIHHYGFEFPLNTKPFPIYLYEGYWLDVEHIGYILGDYDYTLQDAVNVGNHYGNENMVAYGSSKHYESEAEAIEVWQAGLRDEKRLLSNRLAEINSELGNSKKELCIFTTKERR